MATYCVKVRELSGKKWKFLSSNGGLNPLRIHAVEFTDKDRADKQSAEINALHGSEYQAKVEIFSEGK